MSKADNEPGKADGSSGSLRQVVAAVLLLAGLVAVGLFLSGALRSAGRLQDCVAAGRTNCAPIR